MHAALRKTPWNKGKLVGQKAPPKLKDIWAIRVRLQIGRRTRELALFNLAIDSKLRSCDLVRLRMRDVCHGNVVTSRTIVMQQKTRRPVQLELTEQTASFWPHGFVRSVYILRTTCFQAGSMHHHICPRANMRALYGVGFGKWGLIPAPMARTPCGGRRLP
jgi:hypothetical protein